MTTEVEVKANHGWPVKVEGYKPGTDELVEGSYGGIVPAGESRTFHIHSQLDLRVHEIQPGDAV